MRFLLVSGSIFAMLSVILGAFGAHALSTYLGGKLSVWQTGVTYQMFHASAIIITAILMMFLSRRKLLLSAGICFIVGICFFSGSLYAIGLFQTKNLGIVTPIGGLFFISGWVLLLTAILTSSASKALDQ